MTGPLHESASAKLVTNLSAGGCEEMQCKHMVAITSDKIPLLIGRRGRTLRADLAVWVGKTFNGRKAYSARAGTCVNMVDTALPGSPRYGYLVAIT